MRDNAFYNRVAGDRIASRQTDELIGLARGLCADGIINDAEVEFLRKWLAANLGISEQPLIRDLFDRVQDIFSDGLVTKDERDDLFDTLNSLSNKNFELGEALKSSSLPLCDPVPDVRFDGQRFTFTGTFKFGQRKVCEEAVKGKGASAGSLTKATNFLVIGHYATESWKHSSMGTKIIRACDMRDSGIHISIVSEESWAAAL